jgi:hypothetical protein
MFAKKHALVLVAFLYTLFPNGAYAVIDLNRQILLQWIPNLSIDKLDLRSRNIKSIEQSTFAGRTKLEYLMLDSNKLAEIYSATFKGLA